MEEQLTQSGRLQRGREMEALKEIKGDRTSISISFI